jgi:hypothetical protein
MPGLTSTAARAFIALVRAKARAMVGIRRLRFVLLSAVLLPLFVSCQSVDTSSDPRRWGQPEKIEILGSGAQRAAVAIDPMGNAMAVWDQTDPENRPTGVDINQSDDIWLNREDDAGRWGGAELLEDIEPDDSVFAQIEIDGDGTAVVAFLQSAGVEADEVPYRVWAVRSAVNDDLPGDARCIQSTAEDSECTQLDGVGDAGQPQLALDAHGNAVVVWHQIEDARISVWFNRFSADSGDWAGAEAVDPSDTSDLLRPAVAMDAVGNAIAVWEREDRGISSIYSQRLLRSGEREDPQQVEFENGDAFTPQVAVDPMGNAVAVWEQQETSDAPFLTWSNRYLASTGRWGEAEPIGVEGEDDETKPQIVMDGDGNAIAVWAQTGLESEGIWSNRYKVDADSWEGAVPIGPRSLGPALAPQLAANLHGDAVAAWVQFDSVRDAVWSNRYTPSGGWSVGEPIEPAGTTRTTGVQVSVDAQGDAAAVWLSGSAPLTLDVWASRLSARDPGSDTR